jgi:hypothetical protein
MHPLRAAGLGVFLTAAVFAWLLLGSVDRGGSGGRVMASMPAAAGAGASVEADIVVVQGERERTYRSHQLPPDGRLVWRRFATTRERLGDIYPPDEIASWIFRVVPEATEIRIALRAGRPAQATRYDYRRESFSPT